MTVLNTIWKGQRHAGEVMEGDEIRAGLPFMQVIDPAQMQIRARANQADLPNLRAAEEVQVHLDAYADLVFPARLSRSRPSELREVSRTSAHVCRDLFRDWERSKVHARPFCGRGRRGERQPGALIVPRDAVFEEGGNSYVRVAQGGGFEKRAVKVSSMSDTEAVMNPDSTPAPVCSELRGLYHRIPQSLE